MFSSEIYQQKLVPHLEALGFEYVKQGVCAGLVEMWVQAVLVDEESKFLNRLNMLSALSDSEFSDALFTARTKVKNKQVLEPDDVRVLDCMAMLDGVIFFLRPPSYIQPANTHITQQQPELVSAFVESTKLANEGGRVKLMSQLKIGDAPSIHAYFEELRHLFRTTKPKITHTAITLAAGDHRIGMRYDDQSDRWFFFDPNYTPRYVNRDEIEYYILTAFDDNKITAFNVNIQTTTSKFNQPFAESLNNFKINNTFSRKDTKLKSDSGFTLAHLAAKYNDTETLKTIIASKGLIDQASYNGRTPLHVAIELRKYDCINLLVKQKVNLNAHDPDGLTPIMLCVKNNDIASLDLLLKAGADPSIVNPKTDETAMHYACSFNNHQALILLLEGNAKLLNEQYPDGSNPATVAVQNSSADVLLHFLEDCGLNPDYIDSQGISLLEHALDCNVTDESIACLEFLIGANPNVNIATRSGSDPLFISLANNKTEFAQILIAAGANVNESDANKCFPITIAAQKNNFAIVKSLIEYGADVNAQDDTGMTALHYAARYNDEAAIKLLLNAGSNVSAKAVMNNTPAIAAAFVGNPAVATLAQAGADFFVKNHLAVTAFEICLKKMHLDALVSILLTANDAIEMTDDNLARLYDNQPLLLNELITLIEKCPDDIEKLKLLDATIHKKNKLGVILAHKQETYTPTLFTPSTTQDNNYIDLLAQHFNYLLPTRPSPLD